MIFSLLNTLYVPYAAVYYVERVHLMCSINAACHHLTMSDYLTTEIILMACGVLLHCPLWFCVLLLLDIKKTGGNVSDIFKYFLVRTRSYTLPLDIPLCNTDSDVYTNSVTAAPSARK